MAIAKKPIRICACRFPTTIGEMAIAWKADRVVGVFLPETGPKELLKQVRKRTRSPRLAFTSEIPTFVGHMAAQIRTHLRGESQRFDSDILAVASRGPFTLKVYGCAQSIPSGTVLTYKELAEKAGSPKAFRAVGQAMAKNPFPIVIPCHRVIGSTKGAGGFSAHGGLATKARILEIEGAGREQE
jgi:methylated-DNA-[protein]-cysteine S-methyltransferase